MVLSLLPVCAVAPSDRLLVMPGLGGMALTAIFVASAFGDAGQAPSLTWRRLARSLACVLLVVHLVLAPLVFVRMVAQLGNFGATIRRKGGFAEFQPPSIGKSVRLGSLIE